MSLALITLSLLGLAVLRIECITYKTCADSFIMNNFGDGPLSVDFEPHQVYCDMTRDGGGWTLLMTSVTHNGFTVGEFMNKNSGTPSLTDDYSILQYVDDMINDCTVMDKILYRLEASSNNSWGGIWVADKTCNFTDVDFEQGSVMACKYSAWDETSDDSISSIIPYIDKGESLFTTRNRSSPSLYGTLACESCSSSLGVPAPWIHPEMPSPGIIWYWMKEIRIGASWACDPMLGHTYTDADREVTSMFTGDNVVQCSVLDFSSGFPYFVTTTTAVVTTPVTTVFTTVPAMTTDELSTVTLNQSTVTAPTTSVNIFQRLSIETHNVITSNRTVEEIQQTAKDIIELTSDAISVQFCCVQDVVAESSKINVSSRVFISSILKGVDEFIEGIALSLLPGEYVHVNTSNIDVEIKSVQVNELSFSDIIFSRRSYTGSVNQITVAWTDLSLTALEKHDIITYVATIYRNVSSEYSVDYDLTGVVDGDVYIGSDLISISLFVNHVQVSVPVTYKLFVYSGIFSGDVVRDDTICSYLSYQHGENMSYAYLYNGMWKNDGCQLLSDSGFNVECYSSHTTNFAVLLKVTDHQTSTSDTNIFHWLSYIGCALSLLALFSAFGVCVYLGSALSAERQTIHKNLMVAMTITIIISVCADIAATNRIACRIVAIFLHYSITVMFIWMLIEGIHLYRLVVMVFGSEKSWIKFYYGIGWGAPVVIIGLCVAITHKSYGADERCWLSIETGLIWVFAVTVIVICVLNIIVIILVAKVVYTAAGSHKQGKYDNVKAAFRSTVMLLPILGVTWLFGLLAINDATIFFQYIFVILNSLQGVFLFLCHIVLNSEVRTAFSQKQSKLAAERGSYSGTSNMVTIKSTKVTPSTINTQSVILEDNTVQAEEDIIFA